MASLEDFCPAQTRYTATPLTRGDIPREQFELRMSERRQPASEDFIWAFACYRDAPDFQAADLKQGIFDKMLNTGTIKLSKEFSIGPISNANQIKTYLEQLVQYFHASEEKYRIQQQQAAMQRDMSAAQPQQAPPQSAPAQTQTASTIQTQQI